MQVLLTGYLVSLLLWAVLSFGSLQGALRLTQGKVISERWLLVVPFLFSSLLFYGIRYRFSLWFFDRQTVHEFFSIGAYAVADRIVFCLCLPFFYAISVLRPSWVVRVWVNVPLLVFLPFALKLFLYLSGIAGWDLVPAQVMPTRVE